MSRLQSNDVFGYAKTGAKVGLAGYGIWSMHNAGVWGNASNMVKSSYQTARAMRNYKIVTNAKRKFEGTQAALAGLMSPEKELYLRQRHSELFNDIWGTLGEGKSIPEKLNNQLAKALGDADAIGTVGQGYKALGTKGLSIGKRSAAYSKIAGIEEDAWSSAKGIGRYFAASEAETLGKRIATVGGRAAGAAALLGIGAWGLGQIGDIFS